MPCDIGYKNYAQIRIPAPAPQEFKSKTEAPKIDADLLKKIGEEDPEFLEWAKELDTMPLLQEALKRALKKVEVGGVQFSIGKNGYLEAKATYRNAREQKSIEKTTETVSRRWQFEILGIVAELLDYTVTMAEKDGVTVLEAEERGKVHPCKYIKITKGPDEASMTFEHFASRKEMEIEMGKFLVLAERLGVKIAVVQSVTSGQPIPGTHTHDHAHAHDHGHDH